MFKKLTFTAEQSTVDTFGKDSKRSGMRDILLYCHMQRARGWVYMPCGWLIIKRFRARLHVYLSTFSHSLSVLKSVLPLISLLALRCLVSSGRSMAVAVALVA